MYKHVYGSFVENATQTDETNTFMHHKHRYPATKRYYVMRKERNVIEHRAYPICNFDEKKVKNKHAYDSFVETMQSSK